MPPAPPQPPPFAECWPAAYRRRARPGGPLHRSGSADPGEGLPDPEARTDPTGERALSPVPFLVRKHRDRVLVLAAARCFLHCRFCFRRGQPERFRDAPGRAAWREILGWLRAHPEVEEVILSGGDPLTLSSRRLVGVAAALAGVPSLRRWRIHTRAPVVAPRRVTPALVAALAGPLPLTVVCHANHAAELDPAAEAALAELAAAGIGVANQGVLLAGVNDTPEALYELFTRLGHLGITPHYLHHPDRAPGNRRFRVSVRRGLALHRTVVERAATAGHRGWVPRYVVDLPNGAGKCPVASLRPVAEERAGTRRRTRYRWRRPHGWDGPGADATFEWWDVWEGGATPG